MVPASPRRTPSRGADRTQLSPRDPPGTPPISGGMLEKSDRSTPTGSPFNGSTSPKKIHASFNRSLLPPPRAPRVLFPPNSSDRSNREKRHKSPPSVKRKGSKKAVLLWEVEDDDDIPSLSDNSAEHESAQVIPGIDMAVLSGNIGSPQKKAASLSERGLGVDGASDPGYNHSSGQAYLSAPATKKETSSSDAAGPTSLHVSPSKRGSNTKKEQPSGNIPQSPDEHTARLKEIMSKREKKEKRKKTKKRCNTDDSDVSGASSNTRTSSRASKYEDDPMSYLNEILTQSEKEKTSFRPDDATSAANSKVSKGSTVSSLGSKSSSGKWSGVTIEKKYPTVVDADRGSDASSDISGASNTSSSIFAATRTKLKGYLKSYKKSDKKKLQKDKSTKSTASQLSPAREPPMHTEKTEGTPGTLFSIEESDSDSPLRKISCNAPRTPLSCSRKSFEDKVSLLATPPPSSGPKHSLHNIHEAVESESDATVVDLPWRYDGKDATLDDEKPNTELKHVGLYSGPVNELIQPHGKGKLVLEANNSSEVFYGTWEGGKLVSPLMTEEKEPVTDDDSYKEDDLDGLVLDESRGRMREEPPHAENSAALDLNAPQAASIKYAVNRYHNHNGGKKSRKSKPKRLSRYNIGDACRSPQDMIICKSKDASIESVSLLKKWDGAFIKRSSGVWTYAILIERALQPVDVVKKRLEYFYWTSVWEVDPRFEMQDSLLFAIDEEGGTKIIPKHAWAKYVRRIQHSPIPKIPRRISNHPLPTEIAVDRSSPDADDSL